jgi:hypothetical protein
MNEPEIDLLIPRLWGDGVELVYAVLDGARDPRVHPTVVQSGLPHQCLFSGALGKELTEAAPYLVQLKRDAEGTRNLLRLAWGQSWGIYLTSPAGIEHLRRHLRRFLRVEDEQGKRLFFRYYDPRVFRTYLPTCDEGELATIFGPVTRYMAEAPTPGQMLNYRRAGRILHLGLVQWTEKEPLGG